MNHHDRARVRDRYRHSRTGTMSTPVERRSWTRHIYYRSSRTRTTWKFRLAVAAVILFAGWLTRAPLTAAIASSLVCTANAASSDAIVVENFEADNYLVFERAGELRRAGLSPRVLVPVSASSSLQPNAVALGTARLVADLARVGDVEIVPIREVEPISLNAAGDVRRYVEQHGLRSIILVSPSLRSKRSASVYEAVFARSGIRVTCEPVHGGDGVETWTETWHGIQNVAEQWSKWQYYRFYVLPFYGSES